MDTDDLSPCYICSALLLSEDENASGFTFDCPRCGKGWIPGFGKWGADAVDQALGRNFVKRSQLSRIVRAKYDRGEGRAVIITPADAKEWPLSNDLPSPLEQSDNLILWTGQTQASPDQWAEDTILAVSARIGNYINQDDPHAGLLWIAEILSEQKLISFKKIDLTAAERLYPSHQRAFAKISMRLTFQGWERYSELTRQQVNSRTAFMAMDFKDKNIGQAVENYFKPAVLRTGFQLRRLDEGQPAGLIDDQLRVSLRRAKFVIADLTNGNQGAYWEAGFAEGLGRPVIYTCRQKEWDETKTHFDTNHLNTIIWDEEDLGSAAEKLTNMIRATLPSDAKMDDDN